jgi:hypothetical protein
MGRTPSHPRFIGLLAGALAVALAGCGPVATPTTPPDRSAEPGTPSGAAASPSASPPAPAAPATTPAPPSAAPTTTPTSTPGPVTLVGAGDIASCSSLGDDATAALLDGIPGTVVTLGDNVYPSGSAQQFRNCYDPTWGRQRSRTRPAPGNHDYLTAGAAAYFAYFGARAGDPTRGYYAYDLGTWRIYALNSNCGQIGGCGAASPEGRWLRNDLAAHPRACVLAYWHHPLFSSGPHGDNAFVRPLFRALYDAGAEIVLNGHDHLYERFAPQAPNGALDATGGITEFVVGTGGASHYGVASVQPNSVVRNGTAFGVLELTLGDSTYSFRFVPVAGRSFSDAGSGTCH